MKVFVDIKSHCIESHQSPEDYGDWGATYYSRVTGVYSDKVLTRSHGVEEFDCDCKVGDVVYVVSVIYETGDSFGYSTGNITITGVFNNIKDANTVKSYIEEQNKEEKYSYSKEVYLDSVGNYKFFSPWTGFFETLEYVNVDAFVVV